MWDETVMQNVTNITRINGKMLKLSILGVIGQLRLADTDLSIGATTQLFVETVTRGLSQD